MARTTRKNDAMIEASRVIRRKLNAAFKKYNWHEYPIQDPHETGAIRETALHDLTRLWDDHVEYPDPHLAAALQIFQMDIHSAGEDGGDYRGKMELERLLAEIRAKGVDVLVPQHHDLPQVEIPVAPEAEDEINEFNELLRTWRTGRNFRANQRHTLIPESSDLDYHLVPYSPQVESLRAAGDAAIPGIVAAILAVDIADKYQAQNATSCLIRVLETLPSSLTQRKALFTLAFHPYPSISGHAQKLLGKLMPEDIPLIAEVVDAVLSREPSCPSWPEGYVRFMIWAEGSAEVEVSDGFFDKLSEDSWTMSIAEATRSDEHHGDMLYIAWWALGQAIPGARNSHPDRELAVRYIEMLSTRSFISYALDWDDDWGGPWEDWDYAVDEEMARNPGLRDLNTPLRRPLPPRETAETGQTLAK